MALRVRTLLTSGVDAGTALGSVGVTLAARAFTHLAVLYLTVRLSGSDGSIDLVDHPDPVQVAVTAGTVVVLIAANFAAPLRRIAARDVVVPLRSAPAGLRALTGHTTRLAQLFIGSLLVPLATVGAMVAADRSVGGTLDPPSIALATLLVLFVAALTPIPGGAGLTEAGLVAGLVLLGERGTVALSAVVLFRLVSTWLPAAVGWLALRRLRATGRLDPGPASPAQPTSSASGSYTAR